MPEHKIASKTGKALDEAVIKKFKATFNGEIIQPDDEGYDVARRVRNGMIDKYPALIVRCANVNDVINSVNFARINNLVVAVRGGGHNVAGNATCDDGIVIDLSNMKKIEVNAESRIAYAQAGLNWGEFDRATQAQGLATTGGQISTTGIAGLTLGGGIGWLVRKYGLTCDNLLSVDIVTADGRLLKASANENADLFWGIRGGGGNFGVVTAFEYRLHPVSQVLGGMIAYPIEKAKEAMQFYRNYTAAIPDELTTMVAIVTAPPAPFVPKSLQGSRILAIGLCYSGPIEDGKQVIQPLRSFGSPVLDLIGEMPYTALQSMLDDTVQPGLQNYWKSSYLKDINDATIDTILSYSAKITSPLTEVHISHLGGAINHVSEDTAFGHRDAPYLINLVAIWQDPAESEKHIAWTREFSEAMMPFSTGGVYVNFLGNEGEERVKSAYIAEKYNRLVALKNRYDPTNFFHLNQNIKPTM